MYRYRFDKDRNLLDIAWTGIFDDAAIDAYGAALRTDFARQGFAAGYRLLIDMTHSAIQPQAALAAFRREFADFPKASRIGIVTQSALHRLQILREMPQPYLRVTPTRGEALDWVLGTAEEAA
jgi:hypothetical protein